MGAECTCFPVKRLGVVGVFLPLLPTTVFLLVAAWFILVASRPTPLYDARYLVPIVGMILGNCLRSNVRSLEKGMTVGLGWHSGYCGECGSCLSGDQNLCAGAQGTIVAHHGGFADKVRADASSVVVIPDGMELESAGPLFCGGITVFNPLVQGGPAAKGPMSTPHRLPEGRTPWDEPRFERLENGTVIQRSR